MDRPSREGRRPRDGRPERGGSARADLRAAVRGRHAGRRQRRHRRTRVGEGARPAGQPFHIPRAAGLQPAETATFVFSLKQPLFERLRARARGRRRGARATRCGRPRCSSTGSASTPPRCYQKSREEVIARQQQEMLELSTPVVKLWEGILALPLIGTLDSARTQVVMESLLQRIVETGAGDRHHRHHRRARPWTRWSPSTCSRPWRRRGSWAPTASSAASGRRSRRPSSTSASTWATSSPRRRWPTRFAARAGARVGADRRRDPRAALTASRAMERIPILKMGDVPARHHPGGHARPPGHDAAGRPDRADRRHRRARRAHRHLGARDRRLVHRPHARATSPAWRACSTRETVVVGMQPGGRHHAGRARPVAPGVRTALERREGHGPASAARLGSRARSAMAVLQR